jgi:hypothetical protein
VAGLYAVFVCSTPGKLSDAGTHTFAEPLCEGERIGFDGLTWTVVEVRREETPQVAVLQLGRAT